jgi:hypothetical protein
MTSQLSPDWRLLSIVRYLRAPGVWHSLSKVVPVITYYTEANSAAIAFQGSQYDSGHESSSSRALCPTRAP